MLPQPGEPHSSSSAFPLALEQYETVAKMGQFGEFPFHKVLFASPHFVSVRFQNERIQKHPHTFFRGAQRLQKYQKLEFSFDTLKSHFAISVFHFSILDYFELFLQHFTMLNATLSITQHSYKDVIT